VSHAGFIEAKVRRKNDKLRSLKALVARSAKELAAVGPKKTAHPGGKRGLKVFALKAD
jgi:hypothetical protein